MTNLKIERSACPVRVVAPYELTRKIKIKPADAGKTVLDFFDERFPYLGRDCWLDRIDRGWILENGIPVSYADILKENRELHHYSPKVKEPAVASDIRVLDETDNWLAVYKPAPLPMHPGGRYNKNTLLYMLSEMGYEHLKMVHRLDSVTSGVVLLAKHKESAKELRAAFEAGEVRKVYHAVVAGEMREPIVVTAPIRRKRGFVFECGEDLPGAKPATTKFFPEEVVDGKTIVRCEPVTGRTHQIRLHLKHSGFPIFDDPIYGPNGDDSGLKLQNSAISLRSSGLEIRGLGVLVSI
ncbi:pseudouridine synthase [Rhodohalobacter sp.]|uniref:pseudouridine synthase n=1 Tax=Rhodohalobacter sp. TaxID=1974210 RepID=UPI002ACDB4C7|nr:pseudouridine synthase [Rhodohalobacter sp.]MDZ7755710.1 pseudouridine synthase [Rhodohalobacter sp.]